VEKEKLKKANLHVKPLLVAIAIRLHTTFRDILGQTSKLFPTVDHRKCNKYRILVLNSNVDVQICAMLE
jgi:hypothetical protein